MDTTARTLHIGWIVVAAMLAVGCGGTVEPPGEGRLRLDWEVEPAGCSTADVERIRARLDFDDRKRTETFPCGASPEIVRDVVPARYAIRLFGLDAGDDPVYSSGTRRVSVPGGETIRAAQFELTARPATLRLSWRFGNGGVCKSNGVRRVGLDLYNDDHYRIRQKRVACTSGSTRFVNLPPGAYVAGARAPSPDGVRTGRARFEVAAGKRARVEVVLSEGEASEEGGS